MWKVLVLAFSDGEGSLIVEVFFSETGGVLAEVASLMATAGLTVAMLRDRIGERKRGREEEARRREVVVRRAAIVEWSLRCEKIGVVTSDNSKSEAR